MNKIKIYEEQREKARLLHLKAKEAGLLEEAEEHALDMFTLEGKIEVEKNNNGLGYVIAMLAIIFAISFIGIFFI